MTTVSIEVKYLKALLIYRIYDYIKEYQHDSLDTNDIREAFYDYGVKRVDLCLTYLQLCNWINKESFNSNGQYIANTNLTLNNVLAIKYYEYT